MGANLEVNGVTIGTVEVDADSLTDTYTLKVSDLLKRQQIPLLPHLNNLGLGGSGILCDYSLVVSVKPYIVQYDAYGVSTYIYNVADGFNMTAIRGINSEYYIKNIKSASLKAYDNYGHLVHRDGSGSIVVPKGTFRVMYTQLKAPSSTRSGRVLIKTQRYTTDAAGNYVPYGGLQTKTYNNTDRKKPELVYFGVGQYDSGSGITRRVTTIVSQEITIATGAVYREKDYVLDATFPCTPKHDFAFTLVYLNYDATWRAIPFLMKNDVVMNRTVFTMENYQGSKYDYDSDVRKVITAKSDYMSRETLIYDTLYGLGNKFYMARPIGLPIEVRLLSMSIPHKSGLNDPMTQIDAQLEVSEKVLTP